VWKRRTPAAASGLGTAVAQSLAGNRLAQEALEWSL
jgi:hypothetical protein